MQPESPICRSTGAIAGIMMLFTAFHLESCPGQTTAEIENNQKFNEILQSRLGAVTVQRQSETLRLDTTTADIESRLQKLERTLLSRQTYPAMTTGEAEAALAVAKARGQKLRNHPGKPSDLETAIQQLAMIRAENQLLISRALQEENRVLCEIDIIEAERRLLQAKRKLGLQQRLVAKGLTTTAAISEETLSVSLAQKKLELLRIRLKALISIDNPETVPSTEKDKSPRASVAPSP